MSNIIFETANYINKILLSFDNLSIKHDAILNSNIPHLRYLGWHVTNVDNKKDIDIYWCISKPSELEITRNKLTHTIKVNNFKEYLALLLNVYPDNWEYFDIQRNLEQLLFPQY